MSALVATPLTPAYAAGSQQPPLAVIDAAIMQAVAAGDVERRAALMATRAAIAIGEILAALPGVIPDGPVVVDEDSTAGADAREGEQHAADDTTPNEDEKAAIQQEMMAEAGHARPDSIDWMRDSDTRHFYDD